MAIEPLRSISCQAVLAENGSYGGHLKQYIPGKLRFSSLKKRYVVMQNKCIYVYSASDSKTEAVAFALSGYRVETSSDVKDQPWAFQLTSKDLDKPIYYFSAASLRERDEWIEKINLEIERRSSFADGTYDYASEPVGMVGQIISSGEPAVYEPPIHEEFEGPILHRRGSEDVGNPNNNIRVFPPVSDTTPRSAPRIVPRNKIIKQNSEHRPVPPRQERKISEPIPKARPIVPPRPGEMPRTITPSTFKGLAGKEQKELDRLIRGAQKMHELKKGRPSTPSGGSTKSGPEEELDDDDDDMDDDTGYLHLGEEDEWRDKIKGLHREEPDGKESRNSFKEKNAETDSLPNTAVRLTVDRVGAENLLSSCADGTYLVRKGRETARVLTVAFKEKIRHFKIFDEHDGSRLERSHPAFASDRDLVQYYFTHDLPNGGKRLSSPFS